MMSLATGSPAGWIYEIASDGKTIVLRSDDLNLSAGTIEWREFKTMLDNALSQAEQYQHRDLEKDS